MGNALASFKVFKWQKKPLCDMDVECFQEIKDFM